MACICLVHDIKHRPSSKMLTEVYIYSTENPGCVLRQRLGGYSPRSTSQLEHQEQVIPLPQAECPVIKRSYEGITCCTQHDKEKRTRIQFRGKDKHSPNDCMMSVSAARERAAAVTPTWSRWVRGGRLLTAWQHSWPKLWADVARAEALWLRQRGGRRLAQNEAERKDKNLQT